MTINNMAATNLGWVKPVHKGTTPPTNTDMLWKDTSVAPAMMKEYDTTTLSWVALGSGNYTNANLTPATVGGYAAGSTFDNKTNKEMWDGLLYPELFGVLTAPSHTFTSSVTGLRVVGSTASINFSSAFDRGSINPQYNSSSPYRSGLPNTYIYTGAGLVNVSTQSLTWVTNVNPYDFVLGSNTWTCRVAYDAGVQPKGSNGTNFDSPLSAGQTNIITITITGVYPWYATTANITTLTEGGLQVHGSVIQTSMVSEDVINKQMFDVPTAWGSNAVTALEQYNPTFNTWSSISLSTFTKSASFNKTINGNQVSYYRYTYNGATVGARILRWTF